MNVYVALSYMGLGVLLGAIGQSARMIVGLKKTYDEAQSKDLPMAALFDGKQLLVSLLLGGVAGGLAVITFLGESITKQIVMMLIGAGYAGADFIEGFMRTEGTATNSSHLPTGPEHSVSPINPFEHETESGASH